MHDKYLGQRGERVAVRYEQHPIIGQTVVGHCVFDFAPEQKALYLAGDRKFLKEMERTLVRMQLLQEKLGGTYRITTVDMETLGVVKLPLLIVS